MKKYQAVAALLMLAAILAGCPAQMQIKHERMYAYYMHDGQAMMFPLEIYYPIMAEGEKMPLAVYAHGFAASPQLSKDFLLAMARDGNIVIAPQFTDYFSVLPSGGLFSFDWPRIAAAERDLNEHLISAGLNEIDLRYFFDVAIFEVMAGAVDGLAYDEAFWDLFEFRDLEIKQTIEFAKEQNELETSPLYGKIDLSRIALCGHSLGCPTILPLADPKSPQYDPRIKALVLMAPASGFIDASSITVPTCWMTGTKDMPSCFEAAKKGYLEAAGSAEFVNFKSVGHVSFADYGVSLLASADWLSCNGIYDPPGSGLSNEVPAVFENYGIKSVAIQETAREFLSYHLKDKGDPVLFSWIFGGLIEEYLAK